MANHDPPQILTVATSVPTHQVGLAESEALVSKLAPKNALESWRARAGASRIRNRFLVRSPEDLLQYSALDHRSEIYEHEVVRLGAEVAERAIRSSGDLVDRIQTIVSVSCTGYMLPSLDASLVSRLGLDPGVRRIPITELGCSAGVGALAIASRLQQSGNPNANVLLVSVEPSSLCLQVNRPTQSDLLGTILFGDGAAALVIGRPCDGRGPAVLADASALWEDSLDLLRMRLTSDGFRFVLSPRLPVLIRARVRAAVTAFLSEQGLGLDDICFWVVHPGGPRILEAAAEALDLDEGVFGASWTVWQSHGNLSSSTVFFILREVGARGDAPDGSLGLVLAFGPGVTCEMALLRSQGWLAHRTTRSAALPRA